MAKVRTLLTWSSLVVVLAMLVAVAAWLRARAAARRIDRLSESYWELRYENGQLKARVTRLEVEAGLREPSAESAAPRASTTSFVPLSSLKK